MSYVPPSIKRAAAAAGISVNQYLAVERERVAQINLGQVGKHRPHHRSLSRGRALRRVNGTKKVRVNNRRREILLNNSLGVATGKSTVHPLHVEPNNMRNTRKINYRNSHTVKPGKRV
jgi:hypothetical protein